MYLFANIVYSRDADCRTYSAAVFAVQKYRHIGCHKITKKKIVLLDA